MLSEKVSMVRFKTNNYFKNSWKQIKKYWYFNIPSLIIIITMQLNSLIDFTNIKEIISFFILIFLYPSLCSIKDYFDQQCSDIYYNKKSSLYKYSLHNYLSNLTKNFYIKDLIKVSIYGVEFGNIFYSTYTKNTLLNNNLITRYIGDYLDGNYDIYTMTVKGKLVILIFKIFPYEDRFFETDINM